jgi:putative DNA primase/helicase
LLEDIQFVFESKQVEKLKTTDLIDALVSDEEKPWATHNRGKPLTPRQLANLLAPYGIKPKTVRFGAFTPKGYEAAQFTDAFSRYLATPGDLPKRCNVSPDANAGEVECVADASGVAATPTVEETRVPVPALECGGVADVSGDADGTCAPVTPSLIDPEEDY